MASPTIDKTAVPVPAAAERLRRAGRPDAARALLEAYIAKHPSDAHGQFLLALVCRDLGDLQAAEEAIAPLLASSRGPIQHLAGLIARDRDEADAAVLRLRRALLCDPRHPGAWQALSGIAPLGTHARLQAAATALVDPGDPEGWFYRLFYMLGVEASAEGDRVGVLLGQAEGCAGAAVAELAGAISVLGAADGWRDRALAADDALAGLVEGILLRFEDDPMIRAGLERRVRRLAIREPRAAGIWASLLTLAARDAEPDDGALLRRANQVSVASGVHRETPRRERMFEGCVAAKATLAHGTRPEARVVGHALGLQIVADRTRMPVSLRWCRKRRVVRIGEREIGYELRSSQVVAFVSQLFFFEPGLWRWMAGFRPDDVLLDVGANVGIYTIAAAGLFGVRVAAVEPYAPNVRTLRSNVAANGLQDRVLVLPIAVTDVESMGRLFHEDGDAGAAAQHFEDGSGAGDDGSFDSVQGIPIDLLVARGTIPFPTRIKIDVDGGEGAVIEGMVRILADPRLHSIRLEVRWWHPAGRAVVRRIEGFGFRAAVDDDQKNLLFTRPHSR